MAIIGRAEIDVTANTDKFERELKSKVQKASSGVSATVGIETPNLSAAERSLRSYTLLQAQAIKENAAFDLAQQRSGTIFGRFTKAIDAGDEALKGFGISLRDLTPAARVAGAALAAVAVGKFAVDSIQAAANLAEAVNLTRVTFGESADEVLRFAESASTALGQSERAALNAAGQIGQLGKSFGFTEALAAKLGTTVVRITTDITSLRNVEGGTERVQQAIESAFAGQSEPLLRLGIDTRAATLEQLALRRGIIETGEELTNTTRILAVLAAVQEGANDAFGDFDNTIDSLPNRMRAFGASVEDLKASLGEQLLPAAEESAKGANQLVDVFGFLSDKLNTVKDNLGIVGDLLDRTPSINPAKMFGLLGIAAEKIVGIFTDDSEATSTLSRDIDDLIDSANKLPPTFEEFAQLPDKIKGISDEIDKITDARERLNDAIEDSEERVDASEKRLIDTIESNEKRVDEAEKNLAKTRVDGARDAQRAQEEHAQTIEDAAERIADAQEKLEDVREQAAERRADALEALERGRIDAKKRVADAEEQLEDARLQRAESILSAQLSLEEAQLAGDARAENRARRELGQAQRDKSVKDAAENLLETQKDALRDVTELEEELAEVRKDTREDVQQAEEDLADTIEEQNRRVADSRQRLNDLEISLNERLQESQERLAEAQEEQAEAVAEAQKDRLKAIEESTEKVAEAREKLDEAAEGTGNWAERLKVLNDQLERFNALMQVSTGFFNLDDPVLQHFGPSGFASGGAATAGNWNWVGEKGPELVKWGSNATVVSNADIVAAIRDLGGMGGRSPVGSMTIISNQADARVLANELNFLLMQGVTS